MNITNVEPVSPQPRYASPFGNVPQVPEIAIEPLHPKPLAKKLEAFNAKVQRAAASREAFETTHAEKHEADLRNANFDNDLMGATRANLTMLLQGELNLRDEYAVLEGETFQALQAAAEKANETHDQARADLAEKLTAIGYLPFPDNGIPVNGSMIPDFFHRHLPTRTAKENMDALRNRLTQRDLATANSEAIEAIEARLTRTRTMATGL